MAITSITINFTACSPAPANGYNVQYQVLGGSGGLIDAGNFASSPAIITGLDYPEDTEFEGIIRGDCGDGLFGPDVPWTYETAEDFTVQVINISGSVAVIEAVTGIPGFSLTDPLAAGDEEFGTHGDFTAAISMTMSGTPISGSIQLYINGILEECIPIGSAGAYGFASVAFVTADIIQLRWFAGSCPP